jgi:hypothetical protein
MRFLHLPRAEFWYFFIGLKRIMWDTNQIITNVSVFILTYLIHSSIYRLSCRYRSSSLKCARHLSNNTYKFPSRLSLKKLCSTHSMYSYHSSKGSLPSYDRSNTSYFLQYKKRIKSEYKSVQVPTHST